MFSADRSLRGIALLASVALLLAACGGGGSATPAAPAFPVLLTSATFTLPVIAEPPVWTTMAGRQRGRVLLASGDSAPAGLHVAWIDSSGAVPRVLADGVTDAAGMFDISGSSTAGVGQWLRATLPDGTELRAFGAGWTELTVGSEVAVREILRLRKAGALAARALPIAELALGQQSLGLLSQARFGGQSAPDAIRAMTAFVALYLPWNQYLERLGSAAPLPALADVAGFLPLNVHNASVSATVLDGGRASTVALSLQCLPNVAAAGDCVMFPAQRADLDEQFSVLPQGIMLHAFFSTTELGKLMYQVGDLPLLEFAPVVGSRVIYNNPQLLAGFDPSIHAAIKVTRRTYPAAPVQALGRAVQAVEVVLDYEIAILNTVTRVQGDLLVRERRWFMPLGGRVRIATQGLARAGGTIEQTSVSITQDTGGFNMPTSLPAAGVIDAPAAALLHRHAVYSAALNRVFAITEANGGQLLVLDPATLASVRAVPMPGVPMRVAVSADGSRLYVGKLGGTVSELRGADLSVVREFSLEASPDQSIAKVAAMSVDPFDPQRLLVLTNAGPYSGTGAVLLYRNGERVSRTGPGPISHGLFGWGSYYPTTLAWSSVRDEFLVGSQGSPQSVFRFRADAAGSTQIAALELVDDIGALETAGELISPSGRIVDARTLAPLRALSFDRFDLRNCMRLDVSSDLCEVPGTGDMGTPPMYVRLENASGAFLGAYRPATAPAISQCPRDPVSQISLAVGTTLSAMGDGRILVASNDGTVHCGVQVWTLRDY